MTSCCWCGCCVDVIKAYHLLSGYCSCFEGSGACSKLDPGRSHTRRSPPGGGGACDVLSTVTWLGVGPRGWTLTAVPQAGAGFVVGSQGDPGRGGAAETQVEAPSQGLAVAMAGLIAEAGGQHVKRENNWHHDRLGHLVHRNTKKGVLIVFNLYCRAELSGWSHTCKLVKIVIISDS